MKNVVLTLALLLGVMTVAQAENQVTVTTDEEIKNVNVETGSAEEAAPPATEKK